MWKLVRLGTVSVNRKIRKNHSFATESFLVRCHGLSLFYPYIRREKKKREEGWKERFELIRRTKGLQSCLFFFSITRNANFINIALVTGPRPAANEPNPELFVSKFSFSKEQNRPPCCVRFNSPRINPVWISSCFFFFFLSLRHWPPPTITFALLCLNIVSGWQAYVLFEKFARANSIHVCALMTDVFILLFTSKGIEINVSYEWKERRNWIAAEQSLNLGSATIFRSNRKKEKKK